MFKTGSNDKTGSNEKTKSKMNYYIGEE